MHDAGRRRERVREAMRATARVGVLAIAIDLFYQWKVQAAFRPDEALVVALLLGLVPYMLLRGPVDRLARRFVARSASTGGAP